MSLTDIDGLALRDRHGRRKYVSEGEWQRFLKAASSADRETRALCLLLAFTGCRISEALALTPGRVDFETGHVVLRTLKRRRVAYRAVPVPGPVLTELRALCEARGPSDPLWTWCRQTAWRRIKDVMCQARVRGIQATPKGLRHGFGVAAAESNLPMGLTQRLMGHASIETTAIYQAVVGREEKAFARRLWRRATHSLPLEPDETAV